MPASEPAPADDLLRLGVLHEPARRRLYDYVLDQGRPVSRDEAGAAAGMGRTLAAYHLDRLEAAGLLSAHFERPRGRRGPGAGRPAKLYRATDRELSVTVPPRDYELLTALLLDAIEHDQGAALLAGAGDAAERAGRQAAERAGRQAAEQAGRQAAGAATDLLTAALDDCGYRPGVAPGGEVELRNCPFHKAARAHPQIVCGLNLRLVHGLLDAIGQDPARAALEPHPGRCCVVIHGAG
ncbi:MAG TPA: transcriptional regulator [Intrasporangium sp.]|uniref:helix-turn-helix transcriptional regulator n=1 Tax=Intrasporangium sp. TaxID=1925024 RepID=UPI002D7710C1|nr:transcriptional regulator [Intrasporangium sp.]HET7397866.1 transcriptional regulator [Intrasporangium sp.]